MESSSRTPVQCMRIKFPKDRSVIPSYVHTIPHQQHAPISLMSGFELLRNCLMRLRSAMTASVQIVMSRMISAGSSRLSGMKQLAWSQAHDTWWEYLVVVFEGGCSMMLAGHPKIYVEDFGSWLQLVTREKKLKAQRWFRQCFSGEVYFISYFTEILGWGLGFYEVSRREWKIRRGWNDWLPLKRLGCQGDSRCATCYV